MLWSSRRAGLLRNSRANSSLRSINQGGKEMAVEQVGEKYRCNICGNEVTVTKVGGGALVCCGEEMEKID